MDLQINKFKEMDYWLREKKEEDGNGEKKRKKKKKTGLWSHEMVQFKKNHHLSPTYISFLKIHVIFYFISL